MACFVQDVDKATSTCIILEKKLQQLEDEIEFLKRVNQQVRRRLCKTVIFSNTSHFLRTKSFNCVFQEIDELMEQIYSAQVTAQSALTMPDLANALKQIQTQYDDMAAKNLQVRYSNSSETDREI